MSTVPVILAAGKGVRMRSNLPKALHALGGRPLIEYALELGQEVGDQPVLVVIGHGAEALRELVGERARVAVQAEQLGTGHALLQAAVELRGNVDRVLVWAADMPLLSAATLEAVVARQRENDGPISIVTAVAKQQRGFGRVLRAEDGSVQAVVEQADATAEQRSIRELNVGVYCFDSAWMWDELSRLQPSTSGEYYLTDLIGVAVAQGLEVGAIAVEDRAEIIGINTRVHLAEAEAALRERINRGWMECGVTLLDPANTYIAASVQIGADTTVLPNTHLQGATSVGSGCSIGPNSVVRDSAIGDRCRVECSVLEQATLEEDVDVGPFGRLRAGAHLARGVHVGNFGEVKNSYLGPQVKMGHFSYVGDATVG
ncbi:MAG TPA: bifunctional UDP-N-acetylglucosamine diphosphorylase/glucosamine-1-phosphate N-acetyltransferase GlmU, partial [Anaerolineales bacterium]|nr:bifunctional UDP-N-acetylglucosamine diphosphorylase/glucosamine-1-phosphate N-acetyltransferase GlmU [Anaerolineales bacterium]